MLGFLAGAMLMHRGFHGRLIGRLSPSLVGHVTKVAPLPSPVMTKELLAGVI